MSSPWIMMQHQNYLTILHNFHDYNTTVFLTKIEES